ncbi:hypothetical protein QL285_074472 [Trifolium repens]|nr:hypothetical protein QL285_074472 [Trifolium repens]
MLISDYPWIFRIATSYNIKLSLYPTTSNSLQVPKFDNRCFQLPPRSSSNFALLQSQLKHNPQGLHSHTTLVQQYRSPPYLSLDSQEILLVVCLPLVPLVTNSTSNRDSSTKASNRHFHYVPTL